MHIILASDVGSSSCKTIVMTADGRVIASASTEYKSRHPSPGAVEQNPEDWYQAFCTTARKALAMAGKDGSQVEAVGIVGITHTAVFLDKNDGVLPPVMHMFDTRSRGEAGRLQARFGARFAAECFNGCSSMWTYPQLQWIRTHYPDSWQRVRHILFPKDYVRHRLAPGYVTDFIDADGTLLFDPVRGVWISDFIEELGLSRDVWPRVAKPCEMVARISAEGSRATGLREGTPCIAGTSDTAAEVLGSGAVKPGDSVVKLASVGRLAFVTNEPTWKPGLVTYPHIFDGLWYPGTGCKHGASAYKWFRDLLWSGDISPPADAFAQLDRRAASVNPGADGVVFIPHLTGAWAPHWDDAREAAFCGVRAHHTQAHFSRAVLEGVAFSLKSAWVTMAQAGLRTSQIKLIGQGAKSALWCEIVAAVLDRPLVVPMESDAAYGAGLLTAMGAGSLAMSPAAAAATTRITAEISPTPELVASYQEAFARYSRFEAGLASAL